MPSRSDDELAARQGHGLDAEYDHRYTVDVVARLRELMYDPEVGEFDTVEYCWENGYETLDVSYRGGGSFHFRGSYHPGGMCETGTEDGSGVCVYCGATWH